ncbi:CRE-NLP-23 protein [Caenorhabditis remanei]|uniref:CRE-NLP-23 protein n=1 Tax=Caenorhabditis remanei TaxID=31234 RepID=E3NFN4_CAERE|nr:CRE-NLP-23 protein [Caenorhabditis remanei]
MKLAFLLVFMALLAISACAIDGEFKPFMEKRHWRPVNLHYAQPWESELELEETSDAKLDELCRNYIESIPRRSGRSGQDDSINTNDEEDESRELEGASGNFKLAKRLYINRDGFRPAKRSMAIGRAGMRPGKRGFVLAGLRGKKSLVPFEEIYSTDDDRVYSGNQ